MSHARGNHSDHKNKNPAHPQPTQTLLLCVTSRLNDAPVRGYENDVGNKTTMRFFYPESASSNPSVHNEADTLMVLVPFKQQDLRWLKEILYNEKRVRLTPPRLQWSVSGTRA